MTPLLLLALLAAPPVGRFHRFCERSEAGRSSRGFPCGDPLFAFAPASGTGLSDTCACTAVTGTKGEVLTVTRASTLDCRKQGPTVTSGIVVGDIVTCGNNLPRVELMPDGVTRGVEQWHGYVESALRTDELDNAVWTSLEAVTPNAATAPDGTVTADQLNDSSGAAQRCTIQTIDTTSATRHQVSVYVRAGTQAEATIAMSGTGSATGDCTATATGLSGTTWTRLWCQSPAAYAGTLTAVTVGVCVGDAAGDTGTLMAWRYNHHVSSPALGIGYPSPSVQAVGTAVTVAGGATAAERFSFALPVGPSQSSGSAAITFAPTWAATASNATDPRIGTNLLYFNGDGRPSYSGGSANGQTRIYDGTNDIAQTPTGWSAGATVRVWSSWTGSTLSISANGTTATTGSFDGTFGSSALTTLVVSSSNTIASIAGVFSTICVDSDPLRCR